jgi:MYXO-CTERM domain-containing protein
MHPSEALPRPRGVANDRAVQPLVHGGDPTRRADRWHRRMPGVKTRTVVRSIQSALVALLTAAGSPARAQAAPDAGAKTLIDYFLPTPIICPLTSNTWGAASVLPRDICNGLEDSTNMTWQYWDGKILENTDGKFHIYAGRWPQDKGFADWPQSVIVEGISNDTVIGSYVPSTSAPFTGKEQNVTGIVLNDGSFALMDSPGNIYTATSLDGPWTSQGVISITANGFPIATQTTENQTIWQSAQGSFLIISRNFQVMVSSENILGPYVIQTTIPDLQSEGYEDPVVWCSGGQYHLVANMYNARKAYHFTSPDGIHNWTNKGLAYDPTTDFVRYTDGTVNNWYKAERPGVFLQGGHVVAFSLAVVDVDKTLDLANDNHGSKVIVVPFDGVSLDRDDPGPGSAGCPLEPDDGGSIDASYYAGNGTDSGGGASSDAAQAESSAADVGASTGSSGLADASDRVDATAAGGPIVDAAVSDEVGALAMADAQGGGSHGGGSQGGADGAGGALSSDGGGVTPPSASSNAGGCSCRASEGGGTNGAFGALVMGVAFAVWRRRWRGVNTLSAGHTGLGGGRGEERGTCRRGAISREA